MPEVIDMRRHRMAKTMRKMHARLTEMVKQAPDDKEIQQRLASIERQIQDYEASARRQV